MTRKGLQRAGYVIDYDSGGTGFKFVTIQGAGHLVPTCVFRCLRLLLADFVVSW